MNWGRWLDTGMGAADPEKDGPQASEPFNCETNWILDQHRLRDRTAVFPGTGYLDMVATALRRDENKSPIELRDILFSAPLAVHSGETWEIGVRRREQASERRFSIAARRPGAEHWREYASGHIGSSEPAKRPKLSIRALRARCKDRELDFSAKRTRQEQYFDFGPRWRCLKRMHCGVGEALAELELPSRFASDLDRNFLHPALFDLATGCSLYLIPGYATAESVSVYLPMSYERVKIWDRLPARLCSHIRARSGNSLYKEMAVFDLTITDEAGNAVVEIEGFGLRKADSPAALSEGQPDRETRRVRIGISPEEGADAFIQLLSWPTPEAGIIVSAEAPVPPAAEPVRAQGVSATGWKDIEQRLGEWWRDLLGVDRVGLDQDFFDLGGQSLVAVRLMAKIKNTYRVEMGLSTLFEARTIRQLAALVSREQSGTAPEAPRWSSLVCIKP
ncbi:MAG: polyketide synthase dehydratase domain-containing protein, partial [Bryobacteraceae bacterium]